jgi:exo-beta-1,3-glucanase (GH17 family)
MWPDQPGPGPGWTTSREFYFRRVEDIRAQLVAAGLGDKAIWITEFGWATPNNTPGYEYGNQTSFRRQADYIVRAFQKARADYPWVSGMFLWQLNFAVPWRHNGNEQHEQAAFGVLNGDWSPRPAYDAIKALPKR